MVTTTRAKTSYETLLNNNLFGELHLLDYTERGEFNIQDSYGFSYGSVRYVHRQAYYQGQFGDSYPLVGPDAMRKLGEKLNKLRGLHLRLLKEKQKDSSLKIWISSEKWRGPVLRVQGKNKSATFEVGDKGIQMVWPAIIQVHDEQVLFGLGLVNNSQ